jgi:hypothetical protein
MSDLHALPASIDRSICVRAEVAKLTATDTDATSSASGTASTRRGRAPAVPPSRATAGRPLASYRAVPTPPPPPPAVPVTGQEPRSGRRRAEECVLDSPIHGVLFRGSWSSRRQSHLSEITQEAKQGREIVRYANRCVV